MTKDDVKKGRKPPAKRRQYRRREAEHYCTIPSCGDGEDCLGGQRYGFGSDVDD